MKRRRFKQIKAYFSLRFLLTKEAYGAAHAILIEGENDRPPIVSFFKELANEFEKLKLKYYDYILFSVEDIEYTGKPIPIIVISQKNPSEDLSQQIRHFIPHDIKLIFSLLKSVLPESTFSSIKFSAIQNYLEGRDDRSNTENFYNIDSRIASESLIENFFNDEEKLLIETLKL